jgi:hypothetical protein
MAALFPDLQRYEDLRNGTIVGIHAVTLQSSSDTITVPKLAQATTDDVSSAVVRRPGDDTGVTITDDAQSGTGNTITLTGGTAGNKLLVLSVHGPATINFGDED